MFHATSMMSFSSSSSFIKPVSGFLQACAHGNLVSHSDFRKFDIRSRTCLLAGSADSLFAVLTLSFTFFSMLSGMTLSEPRQSASEYFEDFTSWALPSSEPSPLQHSCFLTCLSRFVCWLKLRAHLPQRNGFSLLWIFLTCRWRFEEMLKHLRQYLHLYGCSPVWVRRWRVRLAERGNALPQ